VARQEIDLTNGWEGHPPASDHVVVVSHRPQPTGWHPEASYHFATSVEEGIARAQELAGEGEIGVGAGEVGGQALSLGLIDNVAIDIVPVVFGRGKPYFGTLADGHLMLKDPEVVIQGDGCSICVIRCIGDARCHSELSRMSGPLPAASGGHGCSICLRGVGQVLRTGHHHHDHSCDDSEPDVDKKRAAPSGCREE
jgi:dihydrofolate reductase